MLQLLKEAMLKSLPTSKVVRVLRDVDTLIVASIQKSMMLISKGFLIDGYPRDVAQGEEFERTVSPCMQVRVSLISQNVSDGLHNG